MEGELLLGKGWVEHFISLSVWLLWGRGGGDGSVGKRECVFSVLYLEKRFEFREARESIQVIHSVSSNSSHLNLILMLTF